MYSPTPKGLHNNKLNVSGTYKLRPGTDFIVATTSTASMVRKMCCNAYLILSDLEGQTGGSKTKYYKKYQKYKQKYLLAKDI